MSTVGDKSGSALLDSAKVVSEYQEQLRDDLAALRTQTMNLGDGWTGKGHAAFASLMGNWDREAKNVTDALSDLHDALTGTHASFEETEAAHSREFEGWQSSLGGV